MQMCSDLLLIRLWMSFTLARLIMRYWASFTRERDGEGAAGKERLHLLAVRTTSVHGAARTDWRLKPWVITPQKLQTQIWELLLDRIISVTSWKTWKAFTRGGWTSSYITDERVSHQGLWRLCRERRPTREPARITEPGGSHAQGEDMYLKESLDYKWWKTRPFTSKEGLHQMMDAEHCGKWRTEEM